MWSDGTGGFGLVAAVFFAAGLVKGVLGMGLPTVAMGLLGLLMPVGSAAALLTAPSLLTNVWQAARGRELGAILARLWPMQLGIVGGTIATPVLFAQVDAAFGKHLLGACLLGYGATGLLGWRVPTVAARAEKPTGLAVGLVTGVVTGLTGVFVLPAVPFLQSLRLRADTLTQALGVCFTTSTLALAAMLAMQGHLDAHASAGSIAMVVPALAGMWAGQRARRALSEAQFRTCLFTGLVLLGAWLLFYG